MKFFTDDAVSGDDSCDFFCGGVSHVCFGKKMSHMWLETRGTVCCLDWLMNKKSCAVSRKLSVSIFKLLWVCSNCLLVFSGL